jgi:Mg/Co/Ni transporter MgtE
MEAALRVEAAMSGLILLVFIGAIVAFFFVKGRKKLSLGVNGKHWITAIVVVVLVALMLWAAHNGGTTSGSGH